MVPFQTILPPRIRTCIPHHPSSHHIDQINQTPFLSPSSPKTSLLLPPSLPHITTLSLPQMSLLTLTLTLLLINAGEMAMDPQERETLFKVMYSVSSDRDWRSSNPDPCQPGSSWPGLECKPLPDDDLLLLHVTRLDFGTHPNPSCSPTSTFPSHVFDLPHLQSLFFFACFNSTTPTSLSFPSPSRPHTSLRQLALKSNPALVGPIPPRVSSLPSLRVLTLSQNRLRGSIPGALSLLPSLVHLDLSYNALTGPMPLKMNEMKSLVDLDLSYNSLTGPIPPSLGQMGLLQKLDLSSNSLTGAVPESLGNLSLLTFLALSNNRLSGELPRSLPNLRNLQYLLMDDNPMFVSLPSQLGRLAKLQELRLANSGYSGPIPGSFAGLTSLTTLSLENNRLSGEIPAGLSGLARIYHLNLSRNMLGGVVPFGAAFIRRLGRNLDLSGNPGLCVDGSEGFEGDKVGVRVCGGDSNNNNNNTSGGFALHQTEMGSSGGAVCLCCDCGYLLLLLGLVGLQALVYLG